MIKLTTALVASASLLLAAESINPSTAMKNFLQTFPSIVQQGFNVSDVVKVKDFGGHEIYKTTLSAKGKSNTVYLFRQGNIMAFESFDFVKKIPIVSSFKNSLISDELLEISKTDKNLIYLGNDKNKDTLYLTFDPNCSACENEIKSIEKTLEKQNVVLIPAALPLTNTSYTKLGLLAEELQNVKDDKRKISLLRKYVSTSSSFQKKANPEITNEIIATSVKYFKAEAKHMNPGTPFRFVVAKNAK